MDETRESLLLRIRDPANVKAWAEFDGIYRAMLHRFALSRGLADADAEDVVQHCMAAIHGHIGDFTYDRAKGRFKGWLRTLVNNRVRNLQRKRQERSALTREFDDLEDPASPPDEVFDKVWMESHLKYALRLVREEVAETTFTAYQRSVIEEQSADEVCASLGLNKNQLRAIRWRVNQKLAEKMRQLVDWAE